MAEVGRAAAEIRWGSPPEIPFNQGSRYGGRSFVIKSQALRGQPMKTRSGWIVTVLAVALAICGSLWHPTTLQTLGIATIFLFLVGLFYFSDRLDRIEGKLDATLRQGRTGEHESQTRL